MARVGNEKITVDDFRKNYEGGFGNLKTGTNRKRTYLEYMINEKLLALEGYQLHFDQSDYVKNAELRLMDEAMIEALLNKEVKSKIHVSQGEIREAINKSKVGFKFRYWVESDYNEANRVAEMMRERGYAEVTDDLIHSNEERKVKTKNFETDYLTYLDVSPELFQAVKDLPIGDISNPVELNGKYFIFQMLDIRRHGVTENEYIEKASEFEQMVFYRKYQKELIRYGTHLMEPKDVRTKKGAFEIIASALKEWEGMHKDNPTDFLESLQAPNENHPAMKILKENLDMTLVSSNEGNLAINALLNKLDISEIHKQYQRDKDFRKALDNILARTIRDYFLVKEAEKQDLQNSPAVQEEIELWRDKWVCRETMQHFTSDLKLNTQQIKSYFERNRNNYKIRKEDQPEFAAFAGRAKDDAYREQAVSMLDNKIDQIKKQFPVEINEAILDTISVIDFKKSRWASMQIYHAGSNRPAYPVVDPVWAEPEKP